MTLWTKSLCSYFNSFMLKQLLYVQKYKRTNVYSVSLTFSQSFQHEELYEEEYPYEDAGEYEATYANV